MLMCFEKVKPNTHTCTSRGEPNWKPKYVVSLILFRRVPQNTRVLAHFYGGNNRTIKIFSCFSINQPFSCIVTFHLPFTFKLLLHILKIPFTWWQACKYFLNKWVTNNMNEIIYRKSPNYIIWHHLIKV